MSKHPALPSKICAGCGREFSPKRKTQKYCRDECRVEYYKKHYFGVTEVSKACPNCGTVFPTTMPRKQVYCSPECRRDAARKRAEGAVASYDAEQATYLGERYATLKKDEFKCTYCGRGVKEGAVLGVEEDGKGGLRTVCEDCKTGKGFAGTIEKNGGE